MSENCIKRNYESKERFLTMIKERDRLNNLKRFIGTRKPSIDLGSGGFMPKFLGVTYACDDNELALEYLKKEKWNGVFEVVDLRKTPLPFGDKQFEVLVCSEVIEHLDTLDQIKNLFKEIDRISKRWVVTTPSPFIPDRDHNFWFSPNDLFELIPFEKDYYTIFQKYIHYYITNDYKKMAKILNIKNGRK
jgi:hypothetical protein